MLWHSVGGPAALRILRGALRILTRTMVRSRSHRLLPPPPLAATLPNPRGRLAAPASEYQYDSEPDFSDAERHGIGWQGFYTDQCRRL